MAGTPCPNCGTFMTKSGNNFECRNCSTVINKTAIQQSTSKIINNEKISTVINFKNQYFELINSIKYDIHKIIHKIKSLHSILGKKIVYFDEFEIDHFVINEENFQTFMINNIDQFIKAIDDSCKTLVTIIMNISIDLQLDLDDTEFPQHYTTLEHIVHELYQKLYQNGNTYNPLKENKTENKGLLENKKIELEQIQLELSSTLNILNKCI